MRSRQSKKSKHQILLFSSGGFNMKKILPFLFIVILCFSLISCGKSIEEEVKTEVEVRISTYLKYTYGISEFPNFSSTVQQSKTDKNTFEVSGYFSVTDKYGNLYTGALRSRNEKNADK